MSLAKLHPQSNEFGSNHGFDTAASSQNLTPYYSFPGRKASISDSSSRLKPRLMSCDDRAGTGEEHLEHDDLG